METAEFLHCVLPASGLRCIAVASLGRPGMKQTFVETNEEAAEVALDADADPNKQVYFACATYKVRGSRRADNVAAARSLWLDLDCGDGKPYASQGDALRGVGTFCRGACLPIPILVASGTGIHAYWPLTEDMTPDDWRTIALALKGAAGHLGLAADPSRTADITSLLRPIGTHHKKLGPRPVRLLRGPR